jgi:hypothetical protein
MIETTTTNFVHPAARGLPLDRTSSFLVLLPETSSLIGTGKGTTFASVLLFK